MVGVAVEVLNDTLDAGFDLRGVVQEGAPGTLDELTSSKIAYDIFYIVIFVWRKERGPGVE